jgi:hypothetical protein
MGKTRGKFEIQSWLRDNTGQFQKTVYQVTKDE